MKLDASLQPTLMIRYDEIESLPGGKGLGGAVRQVITKVGQLDTEELEKNLQTFCSTMGRILSGTYTAIHGYELERVEIQVEVTGTGEIRFIGGVSTEIRGGITLVFARPEQADKG